MLRNPGWWDRMRVWWSSNATAAAQVRKLQSQLRKERAERRRQSDGVTLAERRVRGTQEMLDALKHDLESEREASRRLREDNKILEEQVKTLQLWIARYQEQMKADVAISVAQQQAAVHNQPIPERPRP